MVLRWSLQVPLVTYSLQQRTQQRHVAYCPTTGGAAKLAQLAPTDEVTVDLFNQQIISPVGTFDFDIDGDWKHKLLNGLDDIGITLQYEDLIAAYEKNRPAYWQE